jgi:malate dehydrogenase (oxaloacetate-decarboxylating)
MDIRKEALALHKQLRGKLSVVPKARVKDSKDLSLLYTPGVGEPCKEIQRNPDLVFEYTFKANTVAVITDGSAVLGLGNIGPEASLPVMEGKCLLFKDFGGVDAFPICLSTQDTAELVRTATLLAPGFGGINLEDISAPRCFYIEEELKRRLSIPVFHDDQHGTAIVTLAALINALRITGQKREKIKTVINGAGSAGIAVARILLDWGMKKIILCDSKGILSTERGDLNAFKIEMARLTNPEGRSGCLRDALQGSDLFIGVSAPGVVDTEMVHSMNPDPIVFAMANPVPEIFPEEATKAGARIIATGRSDFPNQINNVLAFPGIFRGTLDVRARTINEEMKIAAARAIADMVTEEERSRGIVIPSVLNRTVGRNVAEATARAAMSSGVAGLRLSDKELRAVIRRNLEGN